MATKEEKRAIIDRVGAMVQTRGFESDNRSIHPAARWSKTLFRGHRRWGDAGPQDNYSVVINVWLMTPGEDAFEIETFTAPGERRTAVPATQDSLLATIEQVESDAQTIVNARRAIAAEWASERVSS